MSLLLGAFVVVSTTVVGAQADAPPAFPEAATLAENGATIEIALSTTGLDAAWRSALDLHPAARALDVEYRYRPRAFEVFEWQLNVEVVEGVGHFSHASVEGVVIEAEEGPKEAEDLTGVQPLVELGVAAEEAEAGPGAPPRGVGRHPEDVGLPRVGDEEAGEQGQQRGLSRPIWTDERHHLPGVDLEVDPAQGADVAVGLSEAAGGQDGQRFARGHLR